MSENPILMTQAEYARHRNKSPQYIGNLPKAGILVMRGRLADVAASDAVLDDKPSEKTTMDGQPPASYAQARLADMVFRAKLRRLEFDTRQGKLVEAAVVKERLAAIPVVIMEGVLEVPDKLAPELTALTDERQVRDSLEMHGILKAIYIYEDIQYAR
jgi:phage terminase Nu1 subunit (DNA packaging protein)